MDKILSARLDEAVVNELHRVTRRLGMTKKRFLEEAIQSKVRQVADNATPDVWEETRGAWRRHEEIQTTIRAGRRKFNAAFKRRHR